MRSWNSKLLISYGLFIECGIGSTPVLLLIYLANVNWIKSYIAPEMTWDQVDITVTSHERQVVITHTLLSCLLSSLLRPTKKKISVPHYLPHILRIHWQPMGQQCGQRFHLMTSHHYNDVIMGRTASQITSLTTIVFSTVYSEADPKKHQSYASLAFVRGIHRRPVNSPHKWPVTRKMFPFGDVIMWKRIVNYSYNRNTLFYLCTLSHHVHPHIIITIENGACNQDSIFAESFNKYATMASNTIIQVYWKMVSPLFAKSHFSYQNDIVAKTIIWM